MNPAIAPLGHTPLRVPTSNLLPSGAKVPSLLRSLFQNGEIGAWYDYRDLSTLFQTRTGTTAVTAGEQPAALVLSKDKNLVLRPELVNNGGLDSSSGWTITATGGNAITISNGSVRFQTTGADTATLLQAGVYTVGKWYQVEFDVLPGSSGTLKTAQMDYAAGEVVFSCTPGRKKFIGLVTSGTSFQINRVVGSTADAYIDNISVKELLGNHCYQTSNTLRPTYLTGPDRLYFDADPDSLTITFPSAPGNSTVAYGVAGGEPVITYPVNISGTTYTMNPTNTGSNNTGLVIVNRALTAPETVKLQQYLMARS